MSASKDYYMELLIAEQEKMLEEAASELEYEEQYKRLRERELI